MISATIKAAEALRNLRLQIVGELCGNNGGVGDVPPYKKIGFHLLRSVAVSGNTIP